MLVPVAAERTEPVDAQLGVVAPFVLGLVGTFPQERKLIFV